jgi:ADP-heptose:LPS heptosyltransferase
LTRSIEHLFVYRPGALGDTLLALPALAALRARFRPRMTTFACHGAAIPVLTENHVAERLLSADDPLLLPLFAGQPGRIVESLGPISAAVLWATDSDGLLRRTLARSGVGSVTVARSRPSEGESTHVAEHLLRTIGADSSHLPSGPLLSPSDETARQVRRRLDGLHGRPILAVHPGSGSPRKNWPAERFAAVVDRLRKGGNWYTVLMGGPADRAQISTLQARLQQPPELLADGWPLEYVAALLSLTQTYVGNDSGISHLAGCLGTHGVVLFGPTDPTQWAPLGGTLRVLRGDELCDIDVDQVVRAIDTANGVACQERGSSVGNRPILAPHH